MHPLSDLLDTLQLPFLAILVVLLSSACVNRPSDPDPIKFEIISEYRAAYGTDWDQWDPAIKAELKTKLEALK